MNQLLLGILIQMVYTCYQVMSLIIKWKNAGMKVYNKKLMIIKSGNKMSLTVYRELVIKTVAYHQVVPSHLLHAFFVVVMGLRAGRVGRCKL